MSWFYCDVCFMFPAVFKARNIFLCQYCLDYYAQKEEKPKNMCQVCEEPKKQGHSCKNHTKGIDTKELLGRLKWMK